MAVDLKAVCELRLQTLELLTDTETVTEVDHCITQLGWRENTGSAVPPDAVCYTLLIVSRISINRVSRKAALSWLRHWKNKQMAPPDAEVSVPRPLTILGDHLVQGPIRIYVGSQRFLEPK